MTERLPTYSQIISPEDYNKIISKEHLYISAADIVIKRFVEHEVREKEASEVVELGCGPARILPMMAKIQGITLTGVDHDPRFIEYANKSMKQQDSMINLVVADICKYTHSRVVDVFYSQGVHHHIGRGKPVQEYLKNIYRQLKKGGSYIVGDEFLPNYKNEHERSINAIIWYAHIIASAKKMKYTFLAEEEAKTLLDDLNEGDNEKNSKTREQIASVLDGVVGINEAALANDIENAKKLAETLLVQLKDKRISKSQEKSLTLSRGDYKICDSVFRKEVQATGFKVEDLKRIGPKPNIGAMVVYLLRK